jgi:anti-sigma B factor antagonist
MKIEADRDGGSAVLRLGGRLDREGAEHLSNALEDLLADGVRLLVIDLSTVTYISSAATKVLSRWQKELDGLRGEVRLISVPEPLNDTLAIAGWDWRVPTRSSGAVELRHSSWQLRSDFATSGDYQTSTSVAEGRLTCRLHGRPDPLSRAPVGPADCGPVVFPRGVFGLGLGAIGAAYEECQERLGELIAVAGCIAYFPSDGTRVPDYLVGDGTAPPRAVLASGLSCEGEFAKLVRFNAKPEAEAISLSELATIALDAAGSKTAGLVLAAETAGLSGARLRQSPAGPTASPLRLEVPWVREWLAFAPERIYPTATAVIAGVVARNPDNPLKAYLRPLGAAGRLYGHLHAAVFSYHPLPQRTVELAVLLRELFKSRQLLDVLHLLWDDRGEAGVGESELLRGVGWVSPITDVS